jgi:hypothetical protein
MLLAADGTLKIVDFGVSEMFSKGSDKMKGIDGNALISRFRFDFIWLIL